MRADLELILWTVFVAGLASEAICWFALDRVGARAQVFVGVGALVSSITGGVAALVLLVRA